MRWRGLFWRESPYTLSATPKTPNYQTTSVHYQNFNIPTYHIILRGCNVRLVMQKERPQKYLTYKVCHKTIILNNPPLLSPINTSKRWDRFLYLRPCPNKSVLPLCRAASAVFAFSRWRSSPSNEAGGIWKISVKVSLALTLPALHICLWLLLFLVLIIFGLYQT